MNSVAPGRHKWLKTLVLIALAFILAAYPLSRLGLFDWPRRYDPLAIPDLRETPTLLTSWQMKLVDADSQNCNAALSLARMSAPPKPDKGMGTSCEVSGAVSVSSLSAARIRPEDMRCPIAVRLYAWERHVVQPAARRILGESIAEITHFGSYSCRTIARSSRMSEHATANAFDISGFRTQSGKLITVKKNWLGPAAESRFLHEVHSGLCDWFNATLSPDYNADHADHFHVDMGWWRTCR